MNGIDIAVIVIACAFFAFAIGAIIWRKVKHKGGCGCDCSSCPSCGKCKTHTENKK